MKYKSWYFIIVTLLMVCGSVYSAQKIKKAVITGDKMEILNRGQIVEYTGNVKLTHEKNVLAADFMRSDEKNNFVDAEGNVQYILQTDTVTQTEIYSGKANYDVNNSSGKFWVSPRMVRSNVSEPGSGIQLNAEVISFYPQGTENVIYADKNISFKINTDTDSKIDVYANNFIYYTDQGVGHLKDNPKLVHTLVSAPTDQLILTSETMDFYDSEKKLYAKNKVNILQNQNQATCDESWYWGNEGRLLLTGNPQLNWQGEKNTAEYTAKRIIINVKQNRVILEENVLGKIFYSSQ